MSYYKYAERSSESRVDWNEISKGMVDMLKEQTRLRNEKLDEAVKLQGEVTTTLSEAPMGSDVNANQRVSEFAADAQEYSLMMNKLWRSGQMSYREYMAATNNFKTNTDGYLSQAEKYAANYEVHVKRMEEQLASGVEVSELARVEDFGNFSKFTPVIDAPTGSIGLVGEDGTKYASVSQLGVAVMSQYDRLDVEGRTTDVAAQMGTTIEVLKRGGVQTLESALQNDDYLDAEDNAVSGILVGDNAHTSVLVDFDMGAYDTTHSVTEALNDPMAILMVPSSRNKDRMIGSVEGDADFEKYLDQLTIDGEGLTEEQKATLRTNRDAQRERSIEAVREQLRARLPFKETAMPTQPRRGGGRTSSTDKSNTRKGKVNLTALQKIFYGNDDLVQEGLDHVFGANINYKNADVKLNSNGERVVEVEYYDSTQKKTLKREFLIGDNLSGWIDRASSEFYKPNEVSFVYDAYEKLSDEDKAVVPGAGTGHSERSEPTIELAEAMVDKIPATQYYEDFQGEGGTDGSQTAQAAKAALDATGVDASQIAVFTNDVTEDIYNESNWRDNDDVIRFYVPGVTDMEVFIPHSEEGKARLLELMELVSTLGDEETLSYNDMSDILSGVPLFSEYNDGTTGQAMRNALGVRRRPTSNQQSNNNQQQQGHGGNER